MRVSKNDFFSSANYDWNNQKNLDRFETKFFKKSDSECWLWQGACNSLGYGVFKLTGKNRTAHRVSYRFYRGLIPDEFCVCHTCDARDCINPNHLFLGSLKENSIDREAKGRGKRPPIARGEKHHKSKFTLDQIIAIREEYKVVKNCMRIARKYCVTPKAIDLIVKRISWSHVD